MSSVKKSGREIVKAAGMIFGNLDHVKFNPEIDCPPYACYNCWSLSHIIKDCPEAKSRLYCCNCGRKDVAVNECARCSKAFLELDANQKTWIYHNFLSNKRTKNEDKKHANDDEESQSFVTCIEDREAAVVTAENVRDIVKDEVDIDWDITPIYTEPNDLFEYMRGMQDKLSSHNINNDAVNLDETRMADRDSFGENSIVSIEEISRNSKDLSILNDEPLQDYLNLLSAIQHLSVSAQEAILLQLILERKTINEMQNNDNSPSM